VKGLPVHALRGATSMTPPSAMLLACALALGLVACGPRELETEAEAASPVATAEASVARSVEPALPAATLVAAALQEEPAAALAPPSVIVLITLDTLRRDHLGCYGYFRDTSPRMDAFAAESVVFERALATAASTFPSHLSMLTGLYPHQHGRTSNFEGIREPFVSGPGCASLARALQAAGWRTAGFVSSRVLAEDTGIDDGFETYWCPSPRGNPARAETTTDHALAWLESTEPGGQLFLWVHLWDTHEPNDPPEPYAGMFEADERLSARIAESGIDLERLREKFKADASVPKMFFGNAGAERKKSIAERREEELQRKRRKRKPQEPEVEIDERSLLDLWNRYDACVRYLDHEIGRILDTLAERGLSERAIVAIVADHGQSLGENASLGHGKITNVNTFVPFLLRIPGVEARRDPRLVSLVDLVPTVLGRLGADFQAPFRSQFEGSDVLATDFERPHVLVQEASAFHGTSGLPSERPARCALLEGRWKYLFAEGGNELYDLDGAGEGVDVLAQNWDDAVRLHAKVQELLARRPETQVAAPVSEERAKELLEELEKMGYVGDEDE
jgi:arylsulfatase A-like enzyme